MSFRRRSTDKLDIEEMQDADLRKSVFREMGRDLVDRIKDGVLTDRPGAVARLMEMAFRAGMETAKADRHFDAKDRVARRMTEADVPSTPRRYLSTFRFALFGGHDIGQRRLETRPEGLIFFMRPRDPRFPSTMSRDDWFLSYPSGDRETFSNKTIGPLIKLGLIEDRDMSNGWRFGTWTEWGYELLATGKTAMPDDRKQFGSSTIAEYRELVSGEPGPLRRAAAALGLLRDDPSPRPGR